MDEPTHYFDWRGLSYSLKILLLCLIVGASARYGFKIGLSPSAGATQDLATIYKHVRAQIISADKFSTTTPERVINSLTIADVVPSEGKLIAADLVNMKLYLYQDGTTTAEYPIITKGRPGTPWETPSGFYGVQTKEETHFSSIGKVYMPYSMQFYGNYFIHGWTYYPDGTPVAASFSGGCIKLSTADAEKVFAFADVGTKVFVYDTKHTSPPPTLALNPVALPYIDAPAYLVADVDTGDVYAERAAGVTRPAPTLTTLMTALVANEVISLNKKLSLKEGELVNPPNEASTTAKTFYVDDLFYPLLMQSNNAIADRLTNYYGREDFLKWMNNTASALDMASTTYADARGDSDLNVSTPEDLYRLAVYLADKKSFVFGILKTSKKTIVADDGSRYRIENIFASSTQKTSLSVVSLKVGEDTRRVAVVVLGSNNGSADTKELADWFTSATLSGVGSPACASCTAPEAYRKIQL